MALMKSIRDWYEPWLRGYLRKRCPELEPALLAAIDAFDSIQQGKSVTPEVLEPIVEAASSSRRPVYENATTLLGKLTEHHAEARAAVGTMANNSRSHVRFNAILCLGKSTPLSFSVPLLKQGLRDKSANVREKAADWAVTLRLRELVPDLEEAAAQEKNAGAAETIEFGLKLLRDGYILEPGPDDGFDVTTFSQHGGIAGRWVRRTELESRGLQAILAELAAHLCTLEKPGGPVSIAGRQEHWPCDCDEATISTGAASSSIDPSNHHGSQERQAEKRDRRRDRRLLRDS